MGCDNLVVAMGKMPTCGSRMEKSIRYHIHTQTFLRAHRSDANGMECLNVSNRGISGVWDDRNGALQFEQLR